MTKIIQYEQDEDTDDDIGRASAQYAEIDVIEEEKHIFRSTKKKN